MISKELKFLLTHSSIYGLGTVVSRLVAFILLPLYTRYLTPADYGVLETIDISSGIIGIVVTLGIARALSRFYYESDGIKERNKVVSTTYISFSFVALIFIPVLYLISPLFAEVFFKSDQYTHFFRVSFASLILGGIIDIGMMYLRLIKKPVIFISLTTLRLILLVSFNIIFIVYFKLGVLGILYSSFIVRSLFAVAISGAILWKIKMHFSISICRELFKYALPMIPSALGISAVKQSDKFFVLYLLSIADMGIYSLALKIGNAIHSLLTIPFNMAYIPRRFEIMKRDDAEETYYRIFTYYIFFIIFVGLGLSIFIPEILRIMVTPEFRKAGEIIPLVILSMIFFGCHYHFDFGILYSKKTKYLAYISLLCAAIQIFLNYILIITYGLYGAVLASIITLGLQAYLLYFFSNRMFKIAYEFKRIIKYFISACMCYALSRYITTDNMLFNLATKFLIMMLFILLMVQFRIILPKEINKLKEIYNVKIKIRFLKKLKLSSGELD